jgi:tetratricopeptide (TPR) repeat protein
MERNPENLAYANQFSGTLNNLADVQQRRGESKQAVKTFEEAVRWSKLVFDKAPKDRGYRTDLSRVYRNLARAYRIDGRPEEAVGITLTQRALWPDDGNELVRLIRDFFLAAQLVPKNSRDYQRYLDSAFETLALALKAGYRNFDNLRKNPEFGPLRARKDFEPLLRAVQK